MDDQVRKSISDAVSRGVDEEDEELAGLIRTAEHLKYYQQLKIIDQLLGECRLDEPSPEYWDDFSSRLTERLKTFTQDENEEDPLAPPAPDLKDENRDDADEKVMAAADDASAENGHDKKPSAGNGKPKKTDKGKNVDVLAALAGRSTLPPEKPPEAKVDKIVEDSDVIDLGAFKAVSQVKEEKKKPIAPVLTPVALEPRVAPLAPPRKSKPPPSKQKKQGNYATYVVCGVVVALLAVFYLTVSNVEEETSSGRRSVWFAGRAETSSTASPAEEEEQPEQVEESESLEAEDPETIGSNASRRERDGSRTRERSKRSARDDEDSAETKAPELRDPAPASVRTETAAETPAPTKAASGTNSLDALLAGATARKAPPSAAVDAVTAPAESGGTPSSSSLPDQPSRAQVRRAMGSVASQVLACRSMVEAQTRVNATVNVSNNGTVTSATVTGGSPMVQNCVRRAITRARFPRFARDTFTVTYPYVLTPQ